MKPEIPNRLDVAVKVFSEGCKKLNPIEKFIHDHEPDSSDGVAFIDSLSELIEFVISEENKKK